MERVTGGTARLRIAAWRAREMQTKLVEAHGPMPFMRPMFVVGHMCRHAITCIIAVNILNIIICIYLFIKNSSASDNAE